MEETNESINWGERLRQREKALLHLLEKVGVQVDALEPAPISEWFEEEGRNLADEAAVAVEMRRLGPLRRDLQQMLDNVRDAIQRWEEGIYGICEHCGGVIGDAVLTICPTSTLCGDCKLALMMKGERT